jgi:hypothetical protein
MVNVWFCREGESPTLGEPSYVLSLSNCVKKLDLTRDQYLCNLEYPPKFRESDDDIAAYIGYQHVILEVADYEAKRKGWPPGFYRSPLSPQEAIDCVGSVIWPS